jgi:hypothetical protein
MTNGHDERMRGRIALVIASSTCLACGPDANAVHTPYAPLRNPDVERWQRESTILATCPQSRTDDDARCGLLADTLSPEEASARLADRYPHASIAEMRGTCGLDPACDVHAREIVWLESHNRNVARRAEETQARWAARRHDDGPSARAVGFALGLGVGFVGVAIGASRGVR